MKESTVLSNKSTDSSPEDQLSDVNRRLMAIADDLGVDYSDLDLFVK